MDRQFARAVRVYLSLTEHQAASENGRGGAQQQRAGGIGRGPQGPARGRQGSSATSSITHGVGAGDGAGGSEAQYGHVFRMIEQHSLFDTVQVGGSALDCIAVQFRRRCIVHVFLSLL